MNAQWFLPFFKQTTPPSDELDENRYHLDDYLTIRTDLLLYNVEIIYIMKRNEMIEKSCQLINYQQFFE